MKNNKPTVLIVDDDPEIRELIKIFLEADGFHVSVASDGLEALKKLRNGSLPNVILLDLMMPRIDGEQFLKRMHAGRFAKIPVVVMSGHSAAEKKARDLRAACCLMKPVEVDDLLSTVRRYASHRSRKEVA